MLFRSTNWFNLQNTTEAPLALLTNGIGGMARVCVDLGTVKSKYDCLLGANLHPSVPVDRHVLIKRLRIWCNADGFIAPLIFENLYSFGFDERASWTFVVNAGNGRKAGIGVLMNMVPDENSIVIRLSRKEVPVEMGADLPWNAELRLTVRFDIEDRNFHSETKHNEGAEHHFATNSRPLREKIGFEFTPAKDRQLRITSDLGAYHHESEWSKNLQHPLRSEEHTSELQSH